MAGLGWRIGDWKALYNLNLRRLSAEEESLCLAVAEKIRERAQRAQDGAASALLVRDSLLCECEAQGIAIDGEQEKYLCEAIRLQTFGRGFLDALLSDPSLEEIAIVGLGRPIYVFVRGRGWQRTDAAIDSQEYFVSLVNRLGAGLGRRLTAQQPRINAVLEDGSRLHASMPPVSQCELTIRKFTSEPMSPFDLLRLGTCSRRVLSLLSLCVQSDQSLVVAGNTASGKTTTLNALLSFVPSSERMLLIEETPEMRLPHPHQVRMMPFEEAGIGIGELVRDSLRMRPDRVVVGEVRSPPEARALVESALSGQAKGCYATFHAQSARDALLRMRAMGCMEADLEGLDVFLVQRRTSSYKARDRSLSERRGVTEVAVCNKEDVMRPVIVYSGGRLDRKGMRLLMEKIANGTGMGIREAKGEMARRERFFSAKAPGGFGASFDAIQKFLFKKVERHGTY